MTQENNTTCEHGVERRTLVKGAAWSMPVLATAIATPLAAASGDLCEDCFPGSYLLSYANYVRPDYSEQFMTGQTLATEDACPVTVTAWQTPYGSGIQGMGYWDPAMGIRGSGVVPFQGGLTNYAPEGGIIASAHTDHQANYNYEVRGSNFPSGTGIDVHLSFSCQVRNLSFNVYGIQHRPVELLYSTVPHDWQNPTYNIRHDNNTAFSFAPAPSSVTDRVAQPDHSGISFNIIGSGTDADPLRQDVPKPFPNPQPQSWHGSARVTFEGPLDTLRMRTVTLHTAGSPDPGSTVNHADGSLGWQPWVGDLTFDIV